MPAQGAVITAKREIQACAQSRGIDLVGVFAGAGPNGENARQRGMFYPVTGETLKDTCVQLGTAVETPAYANTLKYKIGAPEILRIRVTPDLHHLPLKRDCGF